MLPLSSKGDVSQSGLWEHHAWGNNSDKKRPPVRFTEQNWCLYWGHVYNMLAWITNLKEMEITRFDFSILLLQIVVWNTPWTKLFRRSQCFLLEVKGILKGRSKVERIWWRRTCCPLRDSAGGGSMTGFGEREGLGKEGSTETGNRVAARLEGSKQNCGQCPGNASAVSRWSVT